VAFYRKRIHNKFRSAADECTAVVGFAFKANIRRTGELSAIPIMSVQSSRSAIAGTDDHS
jgi:hypothetical protein